VRCFFTRGSTTERNPKHLPRPKMRPWTWRPAKMRPWTLQLALRSRCCPPPRDRRATPRAIEHVGDQPWVR
jgi:hypothetical protein